MRIIIFISTIAVLLGCVIFSTTTASYAYSEKYGSINIGYFIVIASGFISTALFKDEKTKNISVRYEIYRQLSSGGMKIDEFLEAGTKELFNSAASEKEVNKLHITVTTMLDQGVLVIADGVITVAK